MRFVDIKNSIDRKLIESANAGLEVQHALHDINAIKKSVPLIPDEKSQEKVALTNDIKRINGLLKKAIEYFKGKVDTPVQEGEGQEGTYNDPALKSIEQEDNELAQELEEFGKVEQMPKLEGKRMTMFIAPKKVK